MLENLLKNTHFSELMSRHCLSILQFLKKEEIEFSIVVNTSFITFDPPLPDELSLKDNPFVLFALAGYTLDSLEFDAEKICFHAGFGPEDFATFVRVDLGAITQIQVENSAIFLNFAFYQGKKDKNKTQNSKNIFLKNNRDLFKK